MHIGSVRFDLFSGLYSALCIGIPELSRNSVSIGGIALRTETRTLLPTSGHGERYKSPGDGDEIYRSTRQHQQVLHIFMVANTLSPCFAKCSRQCEYKCGKHSEAKGFEFRLNNSPFSSTSITFLIVVMKICTHFIRIRIHQ